MVFTFTALVNPEYSSPLQRSYSGVAVAKVDEEILENYIFDERLHDIPEKPMPQRENTATVIAASKIIVPGSIPLAINTNKMAKIINQRKINIGKIIMYSKK